MSISTVIGREQGGVGHGWGEGRHPLSTIDKQNTIRRGVFYYVVIVTNKAATCRVRMGRKRIETRAIVPFARSAIVIIVVGHIGCWLSMRESEGQWCNGESQKSDLEN